LEARSGELDAAELQRQREGIRRALSLTNTAAGLILLVLIGLALAAILEANRAVQQRSRVLPRIFEPFFTKTVGTLPGTGLGLTTAYTIAQQNGLGMAVETDLGQGTTFRIWFPLPPGPAG
jgi:hypothetical protein